MPAPSSDAMPQPGIVSSGWLGGQSIFDRKDERKMGRAMSASIIIHGVFLGAIIFVMTYKPARDVAADQLDKIKYVFMEQPGPGGGGGGSPTPAPPKPQVVPQHKAPEVPVTPVPVVMPPPPVPTLNAPIQTTTSDLLQTTGVSSVSLASFGGGGSGGGIGKGTGNGVGEGTGGGFGGGAFMPGNGITNPSIILQPEPKYTSEAMRAKIQGDVELQAVVLPNGTIGDIKISKSLDNQYGLDEEAIKAAKKWLFNPGKKLGQPVPVIVTLVLTFRLH